ncbi:DUF771 domain-containing protein [Lentibacillus sp. N15]|uniref:DUF771 domain-containing protein n=1 Tax=Lentibacillus songyuanensis TaxID=3136161 RepID=UPI0031BB420E
MSVQKKIENESMQVLILIEKSDLELLKQSYLSGIWWNMAELEVRINHKRDWIKQNILYPTQFRNILDVKNGGFVYYPKNNGQSWSFQASKMSTFLDKYFGEIHNHQF